MTSKTQTRRGRRRFLQRAASALAVGALGPLPQWARAQTPPGIRLEWQAFRTTPGYASLIDAIGRMRAHPDRGSPDALAYWADVHAQYCPHGVPYFLAWHRGFVALFERQLRIISGNDALMLPYWNFYASPVLPSEFIDPASGNPLYVPRANVNLRDALSLAPFAADILNFGRGTAWAFEALAESAPHDTCHNFIGGAMLTMSAPLDPIFWVFHCNIDRLWHAWALPDGKGMPWADDPYWSGSHRYGADVSIPREQTRHPGRLGYDYDDLAPPSALPPVATASGLRKVQHGAHAAAHGRPALAQLERSMPRPLSPGIRSLGGCKALALRDASFSAGITPGASHRHALRTLRAALVDDASVPRRDAYRSLDVVLDDVALVNLGGFGGYFYQVYLNLPETGTSEPERHLLGTVGPFEIAAATHHGAAALRFEASHVLARLDPAELDAFTVSFVRVNGANYPRSVAISIGELRMEMSQKAPWEKRRRAQAAQGNCYC